MSANLKQKLSLAEYFALERKSRERYEYFNGEVFAMIGVSANHDLIQGNLYLTLRLNTKGRKCRVFQSAFRLKVPSAPPYRYPDISALCGVPEFEEIGGLPALVNPSLLIKVLSPTTEIYDRAEKFRHYKSIATFAEYLLVAQDRPHVTQLIRHENGFWLQKEFDDIGDTVNLPTMDCELKLADIYENVEFGEYYPIASARSLSSEDA